MGKVCWYMKWLYKLGYVGIKMMGDGVNGKRKGENDLRVV